MTNSTKQNDLPRTDATNRVVEWKQQVESFFEEDWSRLRTLILRLEELSWNEDDEVVPSNDAAQEKTERSSRAQLHDEVFADVVSELREKPQTRHYETASTDEVRAGNETMNVVAASELVEVANDSDFLDDSEPIDVHSIGVQISEESTEDYFRVAFHARRGKDKQSKEQNEGTDRLSELADQLENRLKSAKASRR
ncbi:MAG: hypothetical protein KDA91_10490 [Planctomycetaceae bacterium]|nr:hypothetical protein [Planctomycetaceae bacterium]